MSADSAWTCPKCERPFGLIRAELVTVGATFEHDCGFLLVMTSVFGPRYEWRPATSEDMKGASPIKEECT